MRTSYSIQLILNAKLNVENIRSILTRAQEMWCTFYASRKYEYFNTKANIPLDIENTIHKVFETYEDSEHSGIIIAKQEDTLFLLSFNQENGDLTIFLTLLAYDWEKEFFNGEIHKDFARYISLLLYITQDFFLINLGIKQL